MDTNNLIIITLISIILILICYCVYLYIESESSPTITPTSSIMETTYISLPTTIPTPIPTLVPIVETPVTPVTPTTTDKLNIPIVKEITFGDKVIPKPPCLYEQVYNDKARKCVCPLSTHALINNKCVEVKCNDGYVMKKSGVGKNGNYLKCMKRTGESKIILVENLDPK